MALSLSNSGEVIRLTLCGAAGTVTGSRYLVESDRHKILIDGGLFQGPKELRDRNWQDPPFDPTAISAIVLTHAHIDHTGYLPVLVRRGYKGPIYCTPATNELLRLLLLDSAHLQEEEARYLEQSGSSRHHPPLPLYTSEDAVKTLALLRVIPRGHFTEILPDVRVLPLGAGHILGSANLSLEISGKRLSFSGDVGRYDAPILPDPTALEIGDVLLMESTYGDKDHPQGNPRDELRDVIKRAVSRGGPILVPAFALGRTQTLIYFLAELERAGEIPALPVFIDSPMAIDMTEIYRKFDYDYDAEMIEMVKQKNQPLRTQRLKYCHTSGESKALNDMHGSRIIIAAGGMVTGGRILHHLNRWLPFDTTTVLFVGYQGVETRGQIIQSGAPDVRIFGHTVPIKANVETISGLSAHGGRSELLRWLKSCKGTPKQMRIVHGEPGPAQSFADAVRTEFGWNVEVGKHLEKLEIR